MTPVHVLSVPALEMLFRQHNDQYPGLLCVVPLIWTFTLHATRNEVKVRRTFFILWKKCTHFVPRWYMPADNIPWLRHHPLFQYKLYHGNLFVRERHSKGVTFAAMIWMPHIGMLAVVWTIDRKAHVYKLDPNTCNATEATLKQPYKVLNRQDDPFKTWERHLGGREIVETEKRRHQKFPHLTSRSPERLFQLYSEPHFGVHPLVNYPPTRINDKKHPIWTVIRKVSYTLSFSEEHRMQWKLLYIGGASNAISF